MKVFKITENQGYAYSLESRDKNKIKKYLLIGGFSFFLIKGIIWLLIIAGAFFGIGKI